MGRTACSGERTAGVPDGRCFLVRGGWFHLYVDLLTVVYEFHKYVTSLVWGHTVECVNRRHAFL